MRENSGYLIQSRTSECLSLHEMCSLYASVNVQHMDKVTQVFLPSRDRASRHGQSLNLNRVNRGRFHFGQGLSNWSNGN